MILFARFNRGIYGNQLTYKTRHWDLQPCYNIRSDLASLGVVEGIEQSLSLDRERTKTTTEPKHVYGMIRFV